MLGVVVVVVVKLINWLSVHCGTVHNLGSFGFRDDFESCLLMHLQSSLFARIVGSHNLIAWPRLIWLQLFVRCLSYIDDHFNDL